MGRVTVGWGRGLEGMVMLVIDELDDTTIERAGAVMAREHAAVRQERPELPADFENVHTCAAALQRLRDNGHHGLVVTDDGRAVAVIAATTLFTGVQRRH